jgi:hypothetical protein
MPDHERVTPNEILSASGADSPVTGGTFLQRTGLILAGCVGTLAAIVMLSLICSWMWSAPHIPAIPAGADPTTVKTVLENYKNLQQIVLEPYTTLFDSIVVKVLLPVFTSILGYIFGTRSNSKEA